MTRPLRPLILGAAFLFVAGVHEARAQTVFVRSAPAGAPVEAVYNGEAVGSGTVDDLGDVRIETKAVTDSQEHSVGLHVDTCGATIRVGLVPRGAETPEAPGCSRRLVPGYFVLRDETTLVIDLAPGTPTVLIRQGRVPPDWLRHGPIPTGRQPAVGLMVHGGAGIMNIPEILDLACGQEAPCAREDTKLAYTVGANYWLTRYMGAEASLLRIGTLKAEGAGTGHTFVSTLKTNALTLAVLGGVPFGPARAYVRVGAVYHGATFTTAQAIGGITITIDGVTQTFPGVTQTQVLKTTGWAPAYGAGIEGWVGDKVALFAEYSYSTLKGTHVDDGEGEINTHAGGLLAGMKVHFGYRR
jgi:opacity protein-like surface antigen